MKKSVAEIFIYKKEGIDSKNFTAKEKLTQMMCKHLNVKPYFAKPRTFQVTSGFCVDCKIVVHMENKWK